MSIEQSLDRLATAAEGILAKLSGATVTLSKPAASVPAASGKPAAASGKPANAAAAGKAADKAATGGKAAAAPGKAPATPVKAPATPVKAPGGKYNSTQVREALRAVSANPALGKQSARDVISEDGGGATNFAEVKPEFYDAIYEACQVLLSGDGQGQGGAAEEEDEFG